jgi:hypothetical protein
MLAISDLVLAPYADVLTEKVATSLGGRIGAVAHPPPVSTASWNSTATYAWIDPDKSACGR